MAINPLRELEACGVAVWNDNISRKWVAEGGLRELIANDGISGVTSNPTIFEKAIGADDQYDDSLQEIVQSGTTDPESIFKRIAVTDIGMAADDLRAVYDRTDGADGYVSIEVSPDAAHDTQKSLDDAHYFWTELNRPNIMIKIPATPEGIPAIEQLISEGINVNITLIFAVEVYESVMEAYLKGLERRLQSGGAIDKIASVASFFVSRVDTLVDQLLEDKAAQDSSRAQHIKSLGGKAAVANARIAYARFQDVFGSERFAALRAEGASVQRPLWASTSTKNPEYRDTMYVEDLIGPDTVNTMPPATIVAVRDHGQITCGTVTQNVSQAHRLMSDLRDVGIDIGDVTAQLTKEGVASFSKSLHSLFQTIDGKAKKVASERGVEPVKAG